MNNRGGEGKRLGLPDIDDGFLLRLCEAAAATWRHRLPASGEHRARLGAARARDGGRPGGHRRACEPGTRRARPSSRPTRCSAPALSREPPARRSISCTPHRPRRSRRRCAARAPARDVSIETCPHYLTHDVDWAGGDIGKINPPLRERRRSRSAVGGHLARRRSTRSRPITSIAISRPRPGGIWSASPGCPGLETLLPVHAERGPSQARPSARAHRRRLSAQPGAHDGAGHGKGAIVPGLDADLAIVDLDAEWTLDRGDVVSSAGYSIYEGWRMRGRVVHTLSRGRRVLEDGALREDAVGTGRFVKRRLPPAAALRRRGMTAVRPRAHAGRLRRDRHRRQLLHAGDGRRRPCAHGRALPGQGRVAGPERRGTTLEDYIAKMDRAGIERSLLVAARCGDLRVSGSTEVPYEASRRLPQVPGPLLGTGRDRPDPRHRRAGSWTAPCTNTASSAHIFIRTGSAWRRTRRYTIRITPRCAELGHPDHDAGRQS